MRTSGIGPLGGGLPCHSGRPRTGRRCAPFGRIWAAATCRALDPGRAPKWVRRTGTRYPPASPGPSGSPASIDRLLRIAPADAVRVLSSGALAPGGIDGPRAPAPGSSGWSGAHPEPVPEFAIESKAPRTGGAAGSVPVYSDRRVSRVRPVSTAQRFRTKLRFQYRSCPYSAGSLRWDRRSHR